MPIRFFLLFFVSIFTFHCAYSQKPLPKVEIDNSIKITFSSSPNEQEQISNYLISKINGLSVGSDLKSFTLKYNESVELAFVNNRYYVAYGLSGFFVEEVLQYKGFDLLPVLIPHQVAGKIVLLDASMNKLIELKLDTSGVDYDDDVNEWLTQISFADTVKMNAVRNIGVENSMLIYSADNSKKFDNYINSIDAYFKMNASIVEIEKALELIKTDNIDLLPLYRIDMNNVLRQMSFMETEMQNVFKNVLNQDPLNFSEKLRILRQEVDKKATIVNHLMASIDEIYFNKGYSFFLRNDYVQAIVYFERSIKSNPKYIRAYYRLAESYFIQGNIEKSAQIIRDVLSHLIDDVANENILALANQVQLRFIESGDQKITEQQYLEALWVFQKADTFCLSSKFLQCNPNIYTGIAKAKYGLYNSYLVIAQKAIENNRLELAAKFIYDASNFQKENSNDIISNLEADKTMQRIIDRLVDMGRQQIRNEQFEKAVALLENAYLLCKENSAMLCSGDLEKEMRLAQTGLYRNVLTLVEKYVENENLLEAERLLIEAEKFEKTNPVTEKAKLETENLRIKVNKIRYRKLIADGVGFMDANKHEEALEKFMEAKEVEYNYVAFPDQMLNGYIKNSARPLINEKLSQTKIKVWGNNLPEAKQLYASLNQNIKEYFWSNDSILIAEMKDLNNRIKRQECNNLSFELDNNFRMAERLYANKQFVDAYDALNPTVKAIEELGYCTIDVKRAKSFIVEVFPLYVYEALIKDATTALLQGNVSAFDSIFNESVLLLTSNKSIKDEAHVYTVEDLMARVSDCKLLLSVAAYYNKDENAVHAFEALKVAEKRQCESDSFNAVQKKAAAVLAKKDHANDKNPYPANLLYNYTAESPWFSTFNKEYRKAWRKLKWGF